MMSRLRAEFSITLMSNVLKVSRQGFYAWQKRPRSERSRRDECLTDLVKTSSLKSRGTYGSPRIHADLKAQGEAVSRKRVARLMRENGLRGRVKRKYRHPRSQRPETTPAPNLLDRSFEQVGPNRAWASDITYLETAEGWLFLCVVVDLFSRRVVGWAMDERQDTALIKRALEMALAGRDPNGDLLYHSDQGCQFSSAEFRQLLDRNGITCSMSRRGNCWDNACVESFFGTLKQELVHERKWNTRDELRAAVYEYVEVFYNRKRRHSSLGFVSPADYEGAA